MKIGELAQVAQCTVETVRYYEKAGLLPETARTAGNFREMVADAVDIDKTIHPHPALGESIGMAAEIAHGTRRDLA